MSEPTAETIAPPAKAARAPKSPSHAARKADTERYAALDQSTRQFGAWKRDGDDLLAGDGLEDAASNIGGDVLRARNAWLVATFDAMRRIADRS